MLKFKNEVRLDNLRPQIVLAMVVVDQVFHRHGLSECQINSVCDGRHSNTSLHYDGAAFDADTHDGPAKARVTKFPSEVALQEAVSEVRAALPPQYDVVYHNTHLHVEYQPKGSLK